MSMLVAGQRIDNYRIVRELGTGGMGAVYEAVHVIFGRRVALKILMGDFQAQPVLLQRFINEAHAASKINHPGIVKIYDRGQLSGGLQWLAMEYLDGQSLAARIKAAESEPGGALGASAFWMIGDIASALAAAHDMGVIHRDLKPANVMIVADPATTTGERAKVLDFGVAKLHSQQMTKRGAVLGTPSYMAFEQFKDAKQVDGRADVFSLGVIAYEMLTGQRPHRGHSHFEVMSARMMETIVPLKQRVPSLPDDLAMLVMRMLEREAERRPTMSEVDVEVRRALGLPPPAASGKDRSDEEVHPSWSVPFSESVPALPNQSVDGVAILVPISTGAVAPIDASTAPERRMLRVLLIIAATLLGIAFAVGGGIALFSN